MHTRPNESGRDASVAFCGVSSAVLFVRTARNDAQRARLACPGLRGLSASEPGGQTSFIAKWPVFLKTIIPSRKATKQYLGEESDDEA